MFALNAASGLSDVEFNDCYIGGSLTLICNYVSSFAVTNSDVNGAFSLSPTTPSNSTATISGVAFYSTVTVGGTSWLSLNCIANSYRGGLPTITATGNINWLDAQVANVLLPGTILPNTDNTYNLGSLAYRFANFYTAHVNIRSNTDAALAMWAGGATTDQKYADITTYTSGSTSFLEFRLLNDTYLSANVWLSVGRTGYVPTSINFSAPSLTNTGAIAAWGHTAPIFQPTITGSRSGATVGVLTALITALAATGLIVDGTTP
jgi:hypothetical protein